jgi:UDP-N-acetyl-D-mannosaminuronic acid transferase (WecB/TagA/CpsF family)
MSRALRAQRKGVVEQKRGYEALAALTEDAEELGLYDDADFKLLDGTPVSAAAPWPMPQQTKEK